MSEETRANIRNSTAEFLIFTGQFRENSIEVRITEESVWLTQKLMGTLFEVSVPTFSRSFRKMVGGFTSVEDKSNGKGTYE